MLPVLLDLKFVKIYTFGVFLMLAFFWGAFFLWRNIRLTSFKEDEVFDGLFLTLFGALFFSRLVYVFLNFQKFGFNILKFLLINGYPGLSLYGALIGGGATLYLYCRLKNINFREVIDYFVLPVFIALTFGKLGAFFAGSDIGTKTTFPLAVKYVGYDGFRHITPMYEVLFFFFGSILSYKLLFVVRKEAVKHGFVLYFFCWYFALIYFVFDKIKENRLYLMGQSLNVSISGLVLVIMTLYFLYYFRNSVLTYVKTHSKKITQGISGKITRRRGESEKADRGA